MAKLWDLPLVVVLEDNEWSQSTPSSVNLAGSMTERFSAFGLPVWEIDSTDVEAIADCSRDAIGHARSVRGPVAIVIHTYRLCHHSKNDDNRPADEVAARWALDPLEIHGRRLDADVRGGVDAEVEAGIADVVERALEL
jgi:TPP-dependent pyruvate/acetoin dehydrogenase alpha subunit